MAQKSMVDAPGKFSDVALRLRQLRLALGLPTDAALAARLGVAPQKLSNYMRGRSRPDLPTGMSIVTKTRVTLDWLYLGDTRGLSVQMAQKLGEAEEQLSTAAQ